MHLDQVRPREGKDVLEAVKKFKEVKKAFIVLGRYDVAAFIEAPDYESVSNLSAKINSLKGIRRSETFIEG
ncbi:MAG: AsnC family protein [Candidatus Bathyarchaeota archaeon BA2]|nr:MAG: AsnC family protein [Candidatus Bathyarchaeota archaeon BA2]